jgi:hypothetical protein
MTRRSLQSGINSRKPHKRGGVTFKELSEKTGISRQALARAVNDGMPMTNILAAFEWLRANKPHLLKTNQIPLPANSAEWTPADWKKRKTELECKLLEHEIEVEHGKVHDTELCGKSMAEAAAVESRVLHGIADRVAMQFPEMALKLKEAINKEIDAVLESLKNGSAYKE